MTQTVADLLAHHARFGLTLAAGPAADRPLRRAAGVPTLDALDRAPAGSLVVVLGGDAAGYELDVALRQAAGRALAAVVFTSPRQLPVTTRHIADRAGLPVLCADPAQDGTDLLLRLDRHLRGGAADALSRANAAIQACREADSVAAVLAAAGAALGCPVELSPTPPEDPHAPGAVLVGEQPVAEVVVTVDDDASQVALPTIAATVSRLRQAELNRHFAPALTRAELIVQIVLSDPARLDTLTEQAYQIGLPVQRTHVGVWLRIDEPDGEPRNLARQRRLLRAAELTALQVLNERPGMWHVATLSGHLLVVRTDQTAGATLHRRVRDEMRSLMTTITAAGDLVVTAGLGTPQAGGDGLQQSVAEARIAADSAVARGRAGTIADTDATGLRRVLTDLYSSPLTRNLLADLLAPLAALGRDKLQIGVETLAAYLDEQCSPKRTAHTLHLHPNAITYRLRWITEALAIDLTDPDNRLSLQLACRLHLLEFPR